MQKLAIFSSENSINSIKKISINGFHALKFYDKPVIFTMKMYDKFFYKRKIKNFSGFRFEMMCCPKAHVNNLDISASYDFNKLFLIFCTAV